MDLDQKSHLEGTADIPERVKITLGKNSSMPVDIVPFEAALEWIFRNSRDRWHVMVTPNLHHLRILRQSPILAGRYASADLSLADGWPVAWLASRSVRRRVDRVTGADLFQAIVERRVNDIPLVLVGGTQGYEYQQLCDDFRRMGWRLFTEPAPRIELDDPRSRAQLITRIARAGSGGIVVVGVGTPRQEALAAEVAAQRGRGVVLCLGMAINFSSGAVRRAPHVVRKLHLEWLYRALSEPRRLFRRYVQDSLILFPLALRNIRLR